MSNGGYKGASPARETSPEQYPGVWELTEQFQAQADGNWPFQAADCAPKSLRFNSGDSASYLNRTPSSAGNRKQFTFSCWVKLGTLGTERIIFHTANSWFRFNTGDPIYYYWSGSDAVYTNALFRDPSAWYHLVLAVDTTQATASNRVKIYVNGVQQAVSGTQPNQNSDLDINNNVAHYIGRQSSNTSNMFDGYLADVHFIDGQQLAPTDFGFYDGAGIWQPKRFTGDYSSGPVYSNNSTGHPFNGTGNWGQAFDGSLSTGPFTYNYNSSGDNTLTLPAGVTWSSKIRVYVIRYDGVFEINGTDVSTGIGNTAAWHDLTSTLGSSGTLSTIKIGDVGTNYVKLYAVELDDVILTNASVGRNSFHLDFADSSSDAALGYDSSGNGNTWTVHNLTANAVDYASQSVLTGTIYSGAGGIDKIFDGTTATCGPNAASYVTFTPSTPIPITSSFRIRANVSNASGDAVFAINGSDVSTVSTGFPASGGIVNAASTWTTITGYTQLTSLKFGWGSHWMSVSGIEIDGVELISSPNSGIDSLVDSPVNGNEASTGAGGERRGNYATLNPLMKGSQVTLANGNLDWSASSSTPDWATRHTYSTIGVTSGKWYAESYISDIGTNQLYVGVVGDPSPPYNNTSLGYQDYGWGYYSAGYVFWQGGQSITASTFTTGDIIGVALDLDNLTIKFYKDGSLIATRTGLVSGKTYHFGSDSYSSASQSWNFGQRPFHTAAPAGFSPLATSFLPEPTIKRGDEAMDAKLYTGNGSTQSITGYGFSPDWVWVKRRNSSGDHQLYDIVRGANKGLSANLASAEWTYSGGLSSFDSDGFSVGSLGGLNANNDTHVAWAWDAGDATTTIAAGSLNSSVYDQSRTWSNDLSATSLTNEDKMFDWTYGYGSYTGTCTWTTTNSAYSNLSGRVYLANNTTLGLGITFKDSGGNTLGTFTVAWTGDGTQMQDTGFDWSSSVASVEITGGYLPVRVQIGNKTIIDTGVTVPNAPSIASTVRANPSAGFSIVSYTGVATNNTTIGHGLNAPGLIIIKDREAQEDWYVYSQSLGATKNLRLSETDAARTQSTPFNDTEPTSSVFTVGATGGVNASRDHIAYCFSPVSQYSAFGSYTGNGSSDGPFVYTGFKISWLLLKNADASGDWVIYDAKRIGYNPKNYHLHPNNSNAGSDSEEIDLLSNGFKLRSGQAHINGSGNTIIYAAFASNPFSSNCRAR